MNTSKQNEAEVSIYKKQSENVYFHGPIQKPMSYRGLDVKKPEYADIRPIILMSISSEKNNKKV